MDLGRAFWDSPLVSNVAFVPRQCPNPGRNNSFARDGVFSVGDDKLGYTFYPRGEGERAVLLYFHANAEVVPDLDPLVSEWTKLGVSVLAFDYRGYGWSTGQPTLGNLLGDCEKIVAGLRALLSEMGVQAEKPVFVFGRSIGACAAVHAVHFATTKPEHGVKVAGLILDSGLMELKSLPVVQQMSNVIPNGSQILSIFPDPLGSYDKLAVVTCPVLSLHSLQDEVVPYAQAQECHNRLVNCKQKTLKGFAQSGHNDVISRHMAEYFRLAQQLIARGLLPPLGDMQQLQQLSVKELKRLVEAHGLSSVGCLEKGDLLAKLEPLLAQNGK